MIGNQRKSALSGGVPKVRFTFAQLSLSHHLHSLESPATDTLTLTLSHTFSSCTVNLVNKDPICDPAVYNPRAKIHPLRASHRSSSLRHSIYQHTRLSSTRSPHLSPFPPRISSFRRSSLPSSNRQRSPLIFRSCFRQP